MTCKQSALPTLCVAGVTCALNLTCLNCYTSKKHRVKFAEPALQAKLQHFLLHVIISGVGLLYETWLQSKVFWRGFAVFSYLFALCFVGEVGLQVFGLWLN